MERVEAEVRAEIDRAEHRKVPAAEARIVAYSDSDSEDDLPFKRSSRRTVKDSSAVAPDKRQAPRTSAVHPAACTAARRFRCAGRQQAWRSPTAKLSGLATTQGFSSGVAPAAAHPSGTRQQEDHASAQQRRLTGSRGTRMPVCRKRPGEHSDRRLTSVGVQ